MFALLMTMTSEPAGQQDDIVESDITRIAAGDKQALAHLYEQTHTAVFGFALSILKDRQEAEDVLQEVYLKIWETAPGYRGQGKPLAWIFTITRNQALDCLRNRNRTIPVTPQDWQSLFADKEEVSHEERILLEHLLKTLGDEERQIVTLHALSGLKHREIASLLQLPLSTVLSRYQRALRKLRRALEET